MHLVDDQPARIETPCIVLPSIRLRIDDRGVAMRPVRLKTRGRIGIRGLVAIEPQSIARPGARVCDNAAEVTVSLAFERVINTVDDDADRAVRRSPDAKVRSARS